MRAEAPAGSDPIVVEDAERANRKPPLERHIESDVRGTSERESSLRDSSGRRGCRDFAESGGDASRSD
jgi:hypothetical protein